MTLVHLDNVPSKIPDIFTTVDTGPMDSVIPIRIRLLDILSDRFLVRYFEIHLVFRFGKRLQIQNTLFTLDLKLSRQKIFFFSFAKKKQHIFLNQLEEVLKFLANQKTSRNWNGFYWVFNFNGFEQ